MTRLEGVNPILPTPFLEGGAVDVASLERLIDLQVAAGVDGVAPEHARGNGLWAHYLAGGSPLKDWLVFEIMGVALGGLLSAVLAGRFRIDTERGPRATDRSRLYMAFGGGAIMGIGSKLARGCTSGQALTGGALLSVGAWLFIIGAFAAGYLAAPLFRRQWL